MKEIAQVFSSFMDAHVPFLINYVGESVCDGTFLIKRNDCRSYSLEYILSGEGVLHINGKTYIPRQGDIFFLDKHSNHEYYCTKDNPWHKIFICFDGRLADAFAETYLQTGEYVFRGEQLQRAFCHIFKTAFNSEYDYIERHNLILPELMKAIMAIPYNAPLAPPDLADKIKRELDRHLQTPYTVKQLAKELNYTDNHIINVFMGKFGVTPYQYYNRKKIQLAQEYLKTTQLTVAEIAELLCFSNAGYFAVCFKEAVGVSPSQYRKQSREI